MRVYIELLKNSFQSNIAYKLNLILSIVSKVVLLFIQVSIWKALIKGSVVTNTTVGAISLKEMITYTILSTTMASLIWSVLPNVNKKITSGEITMDLIKPLNFKRYIFFDFHGGTLFRLIFEVIPVFVVGLVVFGFEASTWDKTILFIVTTINAIILYFMISYVIGLLAFWFLNVNILGSLLFTLTSVLSGSIIPLWFFPKTFYEICQYLPFGLIYNSPISIYLGKISLSGAFIIILQQYLWIAALLLIEKSVWHRGIKKLVLQGG
jgi:ABC-2 type transport system permease protein